MERRDFVYFILNILGIFWEYLGYIFDKLLEEGIFYILSCGYHGDIFDIYWNTLGKKEGGAMSKKVKHLYTAACQNLCKGFCKMKIFNKGNHFLDLLSSLAVFCPASADRAKPRAFQSISKHIRKWSE